MPFSDGCIDLTLTSVADNCVLFQKSTLCDSKSLNDLNLHNSHLYVNVLFKGSLLEQKKVSEKICSCFPWGLSRQILVMILNTFANIKD